MRIVVPIRHNRPLMEDDLPILSSPLPDSRSTRDACTVLHKRISQEKHIFSESPAVELRCLPHIFMTRSVPLLQLIQNEVSRVATTPRHLSPKTPRPSFARSLPAKLQTPLDERSARVRRVVQEPPRVRDRSQVWVPSRQTGDREDSWWQYSYPRSQRPPVRKL